MFSIKKLTIALLWVCLAAVGQTAGAAILLVDCASGPFFEIQDAIDVAAAGDSVVVHECTTGPYEPFELIAAERVHVLAADLGSPPDHGSQRVGVNTFPLTLFEPAVVVEGVAADGFCVSIVGGVSVSVKGFYLQDCFGFGIDVQGSEDVVIVDNRIEGAGDSGIRDVGTRNTQITGNTIISSAGNGISLEQSTSALLTDNLIGLNARVGIFLLGTDNHVVNNEVRLNAFEGILDCCSTGSRIERNTVLANGGVANILIDAPAFDADVIGNEVAGSLSDLGTGTDLSDN